TDERRGSLYGEVYEELHRATPELGQLVRKKSPEDTAASVRVRLRYLRPFLQPDVDFMEVGAGDCSLALEAARHVRTSLAVEVSDAIAEGTTPPANFKLLLADAVGLSLDSGSLDVIYSNDF